MLPLGLRTILDKIAKYKLLKRNYLNLINSGDIASLKNVRDELSHLGMGLTKSEISHYSNKGNIPWYLFLTAGDGLLGSLILYKSLKKDDQTVEFNSNNPEETYNYIDRKFAIYDDKRVNTKKGIAAIIAGLGFVSGLAVINALAVTTPAVVIPVVSLLLVASVLVSIIIYSHIVARSALQEGCSQAAMVDQDIDKTVIEIGNRIESKIHGHDIRDIKNVILNNRNDNERHFDLNNLASDANRYRLQSNDNYGERNLRIDNNRVNQEKGIILDK